MRDTPVVPIVEVLRHTEQGMNMPFLCTGADGKRYYVKGQQTNRASLWSEWICAHVARALGLPIPHFSLVQVDEDLLPELPKEWQQLGCLPAFGSCEHAHTVWLEPALCSLVPQELQRKVLVFDCWVHNSDRCIGNPNLLWESHSKSLVVIDHNQAFAPNFDLNTLCQEHIFAAQWPHLISDWIEQAHYAQWLQSALPAAEQALAQAPQEWLWENSEFDIPAKFDPAAALKLLQRCTTPDLWRM